jgi:regulator of protease activity HflC (stomatin/prohibitin superfamily)
MGKVGGIVTGFIIALLVIGGFMCTEKIPAGYVGVVYNMNGGVEDEVLTQGWKFVSPTKKVTKYSIALEPSYMTADKQGDSEDDESFEIPTKEGASLETDVAFSYSYKLEEVPNTFARFRGQDGKAILKSFIKPKMQAWIKEITPEFSMMEIVSTKRGAVNAALTERLGERFEPYGIVIDNIALADVRPDDETARAITEKIQAQEALEKAKVTAEKDKVEANKNKEVAEIAAEQARIEAQGAADAKLIEANAEAEANKMIAESLTDKLNENTKIKKWNGVVSYITGNATPIIDMTGIGETE